MGIVGGGVSRRRLLLGVLVSVGIIWFMFLAISVNRHQPKRTVVVPLNVISKHLKLVSKQRHALHSNSGMIFVSKRRVPNGPDPIHNRYTHLSSTYSYFIFFYFHVVCMAYYIKCEKELWVIKGFSKAARS